MYTILSIIIVTSLIFKHTPLTRTIKGLTKTKPNVIFSYKKMF